MCFAGWENLLNHYLRQWKSKLYVQFKVSIAGAHVGRRIKETILNLKPRKREICSIRFETLVCRVKCQQNDKFRKKIKW